MEEQIINKWHLDCLGTHNEFLYSELIREEDVVSENLKELEEYSVNNSGFLRGYYARKGKTKYWVDEKVFSHLPIKVEDKDCEELVIKEDVVLMPLKPIPFKIRPESKLTIRELIDSFVPFDHTNPLHWRIAKVVTLTSYISKVFICISSKSHFGKSSLFDCLNGVTDKTPVFKPRSIPGTLHYMNGFGAMVFDEIQGCKKEVKDIIEHIALEIGGGKTIYHNGALRSSYTKQTYNCILQSLVFLYNNVSNYANPRKDFFEYIFRNNTAIDNRFLKLKFDGELTEVFKKDFDIVKAAKDNRGYYIDVAKTLLYLQELKRNNGYQQRWNINTHNGLTGRRRQVYEDILWLADMYCKDQSEFDEFVRGLDKCISDYRVMVDNISAGSNFDLDEELIGDTDE